MLTFFIGPSGYGKTYKIIEEINALLSSNAQNDIYVIVPEQETVKMEAELLSACGNEINKNVEIINFSRLANRVFREVGGITYKYIDAAGKDLMTAVIFERLKNVCPEFADYLSDTTFIQLLRAEMDKLRNRGYHADDIIKVKEKLSNEDKGGQTLLNKLDSLATVFSAYEKSLKDNAGDTTDDIIRLSQALEEYDFFDNTHIFIDGFYDFTAPQYSVIEKIMKTCTDMTISLPMSITDNIGIFRKPKLAYTRLREIAEKQNIEYKTIVFDKNHRQNNPHLCSLAEAIMTGNDIKSKSPYGISVTAVNTVYDECVYVAHEIVNLVKNGAKFSDIAVCSADISTYSTTLENILESYNIPHLTCTQRAVMQMSIAAFILSALDVINSSFYSKSMKSYLKSPYLPLNEEEAYILENYVTMWKISKKLWFADSDWTMNPRGYIENITQADLEELKLINSARKKVFAPLKKLYDAFSDRSSVRKKAEAIAEFFKDNSAWEQVKNRNNELGEMFCVGDYDDEVAAWNTILATLDIMVEGAGEINFGKDKFIKYFKLMLFDSSFGRIPSSVDEVEIGNADFVRSKNVKHLFFLGFNDSIFPSVDTQPSVFTEREQKWLYDNDLKIDENSEEKLNDQNFVFLTAVLKPSESLHFVLHTESSQSIKAHLSPSFFYGIIKDVLGTEIQDGNELSAVNYSELFQKAVQADNIDENQFESKAAKELFRKAQELKKAIMEQSSPYRLTAIKDFRTDMKMSYSNLEKYQTCKFSYYAEYMLRLRTRRTGDFNSADIGSYVHKVLEIVLRELCTSGKAIEQATDKEIIKVTQDTTKEYLEKVATNINENSPKYKYLVKMLSSFVILIIENIREEFKASLFRPAYFEESLTNSNVTDPYTVNLRDGSKLIFKGIVDRVDTFTDKNGMEYIRVVDYKTKTGGKTFSLEDVLNGLNVQMLIYLFAFTNTKDRSNRREAGIMYMPASRASMAPDGEDIGDEARRNKINNDMKRSGMFLNDSEIIKAMENTDIGSDGETFRFIDLKVGKEPNEYNACTSSTLTTLEGFGLIKRYIDMMFNNIVDSIKLGDIEAAPIEPKGNDRLCCDYCPYHPICRFEGEARERLKTKEPLVMMQEMLDKHK